MTRGAMADFARASLVLLALAHGIARGDEPPTDVTDPADPTNPIASLSARPGGLTANDAAARAGATSIEVRVRGEDVIQAAAGVDQALAALFPRLQLLARYTRLSPVTLPSLGPGYLVAVPNGTPLGPNGELGASTQLYGAALSFPVLLNNTLFQASLSLPISDYVLRFAQGLSAAAHAKEAARLATRGARIKAAADARLLFYAWVRARGQALVAEQALAQARAHLGDATAMFSAGMLSKADVLRVDSQAAAIELLVEQSRGLVEVLQAELRVTMHDDGDGDRPYQIGEDVLAELPPIAAEPTDALTAEAESRRPELRALIETRRSLDDQARLARAGYLPQIAAFGDAGYANPNPRVFPQVDQFSATWDVGVQVAWAPNDAAVAWAAAKGAVSRAAQVRAQLDGLHDAVRIEIAGARAALAEAQLADGTTARGLTAAEESYRVRRELFRNGRATSVELSDAEADLTRARLAALGAKIDQRIARVKLAHATGRDAK